MTKRIVVLMGGTSPEREVSLVSGKACAKALREAGYDVSEVDVSHDVRTLVKALTPAPDAVFNALHGRQGEDGCVQGILELMRIPYTHSGVLASALAMNKPVAKRVFEAAGLTCPEGRVVSRDTLLAGDVLERPFVMKPIDEGSSVGVKILQPGDNRPPLNGDEWLYHDEILVERFIPGRELTVSVMGDRPLAVTEIKPRQGFYDYESKYTENKADHVVPARDPEVDLRSGHGGSIGGASGARLPRRESSRFPLRRHQERPRKALSAGDQHSAGHDAAEFGARAGGLSGHVVPRDL